MTVLDSINYTTHTVPKFSASDRIISETKHQTDYVSAIFTPKEAITKVSNNAIAISFTYDIPDIEFSEEIFNSIQLKVGKKTSRIFEIKARFGGQNVKMLLKKLRDIKKVISEQQRKNRFYDFGKSYELVLAVLDLVTNHIQSQSDKIQSELFA